MKTTTPIIGLFGASLGITLCWPFPSDGNYDEIVHGSSPANTGVTSQAGANGNEAVIDDTSGSPGDQLSYSNASQYIPTGEISFLVKMKLRSWVNFNGMVAGSEASTEDWLFHIWGAAGNATLQMNHGGNTVTAFGQAIAEDDDVTIICIMTATTRQIWLKVNGGALTQVHDSVFTHSGRSPTTDDVHIGRTWFELCAAFDMDCMYMADRAWDFSEITALGDDPYSAFTPTDAYTFRDYRGILRGVQRGVARGVAA